MGLTIWVCVLCMQACLLSHAALECSGTSETQGEDCVRRQTTGGQHEDAELQRLMPASNALRREAPSRRLESIAPITNPLRRKRYLERRGPTQHSNMPGAISVRGFPNTLIQAERARRHLGPSANKRKTKRKSRVGSFSLLSNNNPSAPIQVTRARRQVDGEPSRGKSGRSGAYSILGDPQAEGQSDRPKRSIQRRKKAARKIVCS